MRRDNEISTTADGWLWKNDHIASSAADNNFQPLFETYYIDLLPDETSEMDHGLLMEQLAKFQAGVSN